MKNLYLLILLIIVNTAFAQNIVLDDDNQELFDCGTTASLLSPGGVSYGQNVQFVKTICTNGDPLSIELISAFFGSPGDFLCIYDGVGATAPLIDCFTSSNLPSIGFQVRTSINNLSGCLTFQFVSDGTTTGGNFELALDCLPPCKTVEALVLATDPAVNATDGIYINSCPGEPVSFFGTGVYDTNLTGYAQSDSNSTFIWSYGDGTLDTTQNSVHFFPDGQIFSVSLQVVDVNACKSSNEINLRVRQARPINLQFTPDTDLICLGDTTEFIGSIEGIAFGNGTAFDTLTGQSSASVVDTVFLPDDSNNNSGDGITTPVIYPLDIFGYIPGTLLTDTNDLLSICLDIEHSYVGDLDIRIVCPNGQFTNLIDFSPPNGFGNNLGTPAGFGGTFGQPLTYCWSPSSVNGSIAGGQPALANPTIAAGTYEPTGEWADLIGCPLNGEWQIQVFDDFGGDDGYTFAADIAFNPAFLLDPDTFLVFYSNPLWDNDPQIITPLNNTNISVTATDTASTWLFFNVESNMECDFRDSVLLDVDFFEVSALPADTTVCFDTLQLSASLVGVPQQCLETYTVSSIPVNTLAANGPVIVQLADDAVSAPINLPFDFEFFCEIKPSFRISSNGFLTFTSTANSLTPQLIPSPTTANDLIALFWTDLDPQDDGQVRHWTSGVAPNRVKVIEFLNVPHWPPSGGAPRVTGQIHMYESSNFIEIHCTNCQSDGGNKTIGIENVNGTVAYAAPGHNRTSSTVVNQAWRFVPEGSLGNYSFSWLPNTNISDVVTQSPEVWPSASTNYVVSVTNENNCVIRDTAVINVAPTFVPIVSNDTTICLGESAQLNVIGGQNFTWSPNNGTISNNTVANPSVTPTANATYFVVADSAGCSAIDSVQVFVIDNNVQLLSQDTTICSGESVQLNIIGSSIAIWTPADGSLNSTSIPNPIASPIATTTYSVAMGPTACAVNEQLTITVLPTDGNLLTQDSEICEGETIDLESNGAGTYSWTPNDGTLSSTTASSTTASPLNTTTYFVLFNAGQCESLDSVNVVVNLNPVVEINNGQASFDICDGESLNLTGNNFANGQYTWEDNQGNVVSNVDSYNADASGIYTLLVLDDNNCSGEASVEIFVRITPDMDYTNLRTILCCIGDEVALNPLDYLLNAANVAEVIVNGAFVQGSVLEESGMNSTYIIEVFTNEACTSLDTVEFSTNCINPEIVAADSVFLGGSTPVNVNFTDNGGITVINWLEGSLFENSTVASTNLLANQSEEFYNYSVSVEETFVLNNPDSSLTCVETVEDIIYTINVNDPLIPDAFSPNGDNVNQLFFPVNLDINSTLVALRVFDRWGNEVYNYQAGGLGWDGTYEGVNQPVDVYSYYIKIEKPSGDFIKSGSLTLIR